MLLCALAIALSVNYFIGTKQGWLPCATVIVMLTTTGSAVYQELMIFFLSGSHFRLTDFPISSAFMRMYDIVLGSSALWQLLFCQTRWM